jgi:hypothetical protein
MIDARVVDIQPHPDQATNNPGCWAVRFRVSYDGRTRVFWRWHNVRETNANGAYVTPSNEEKPPVDKILEDFWSDTFLDLHGFDFREGSS